MTIVAALDPLLFALRVNARDTEEAISIIDLIRVWALVASRATAVRTAITAHAVPALATADCFPSPPAIQDLLSRFGLQSVYAANDVRQGINSLLERSLVLEDLTGFGELALDSFAADPSLLRGDAPEQVRAACELTQAACALAVQLDKLSRSRSAIQCASLDDQTDSIRIEARLLCDDSQSSAIQIADVTAALHVVRKPTHLISRLNADGLWADASQASDLLPALALGAFRELSQHGQGHSWEDFRLRFLVGSDFFPSLQRHQACKNQRYSASVFHRCCSAMLSLDEVGKPMWKLQGSKRAVWRRASDGAVAYRLHVTERHEALRLMIWKHPGGTIEFANVGNKAELHIEEGTVKERLAFDWDTLGI